MSITETEITIDACPQTVWAVLDDIDRYPEWNPIVPQLDGRTTFGQPLKGEFSANGHTSPLTPSITRVIGARSFRWVSVIPGEHGFSAEHMFDLTPTETGTHVLHREIFTGPGAAAMQPLLDTGITPAYVHFNQALKTRAESLAQARVQLHPELDATKGDAQLTAIACRCSSEPVQVKLNGEIYHNHLCGCSRCWKPEGATFAMTAITASDTTEIVTGKEHLDPVDPKASIVRHACRRCGTHMLGTVEDPDHHFYGNTFVHPELAAESIYPALEFAGFVSSLIEMGEPATKMQAIRTALATAGIPAYDAFSTEIMDIIAFHQMKLRTHAPLTEER